jgi:hypothetical protein
VSLSLSGRAARAFNFARSAFVNGGRVSGVHLAIFVFIAQFFFAGKSLGIELDVLEVESIFGGKSFDVFSWTFSSPLESQQPRGTACSRRDHAGEG